MRRADLFLFPSILEGHPQVLGQASACGLPSIAMNLYRPDYVLNRESGFWQNPMLNYLKKWNCYCATRTCGGRCRARLRCIPCSLIGTASLSNGRKCSRP